MKCIFCDSDNVKFVRTLEIPPTRWRKSTVLISLYQCQDCGRKFRKGKKEELSEILIEE